jgi:hypothetical protein
MVSMSIYRAREARAVWDQRVVLLATQKEDIPLVRIALETGKPVLVGLDGIPTIVKPQGDGDEKQRFESLFDDALTGVDLQKMQDANVSHPDQIPLVPYRVELRVVCDFDTRIVLALLAKNVGEIRPTVRDLMNQEPFQMAFMEQVAEALIVMLHEENSLSYTIEDTTTYNYENKKPPAELTGEKKWLFIQDDD